MNQLTIDLLGIQGKSLDRACVYEVRWGTYGLWIRSGYTVDTQLPVPNTNTVPTILVKKLEKNLYLLLFRIVNHPKHIAGNLAEVTNSDHSFYI